MEKQRVLVFASGTKDGGGSGFQNLVEQSRRLHQLNFDVVGVVSNYAEGGVAKRAAQLGVKFCHFSSRTWSGEEYRSVYKDFNPHLVALSGWLKPVRGLDPSRTINIHPGLLSVRAPSGQPRYGGKDMHGDAVHQAVLNSYDIYSGVSMHFVTDFDDLVGGGYDRGPQFFECRVNVDPTFDNVPTLRKRVNDVEHLFQPVVTSWVANNYIRWSGALNRGVEAPMWYPYLPSA